MSIEFQVFMPASAFDLRAPLEGVRDDGAKGCVDGDRIPGMCSN
jgi:hypothetical protein